MGTHSRNGLTCIGLDVVVWGLLVSLSDTLEMIVMIYCLLVGQNALLVKASSMFANPRA